MKTLVKHLAVRRPGSRVVALDSWVVIGAMARGRSASRGLSHVLCSALPYVLGGDIYIGALHVPTQLNRADNSILDHQNIIINLQEIPVRILGTEFKLIG